MTLLSPQEADMLAEPLADALKGQRWFGGKARAVRSQLMLDYGEMQYDSGIFPLAIVRLVFDQDVVEDYFIPLSLSGGDNVPLSIRIEKEGKTLVLSDALFDAQFMEGVMHALAGNRRMEMRKGQISTVHTRFFADPGGWPMQTSVISSEQSNTSVVIGRSSIYKSYRKIEKGVNPDCEVPDALSSSSGFSAVPKPLGRLEYTGETKCTVGSLSEFVENEGDCWTYFLKELSLFTESAASGPEPDDRADNEHSCLGLVSDLGRVTAQLHNALASIGGNEAFAPVAVSHEDTLRWAADFSKLTDSVMRTLEARRHLLEGAASSMAGRLMAEKQKLSRSADNVADLHTLGVRRIRVHGDYHLGQVLKAGRKLYIIDFEGEPMRSLDYRRSPHCALKDVSGMLRSLDYAASFSARRAGTPESESIFSRWSRLAQGAFLESYWASSGRDMQFLPPTFDGMEKALAFFTIEKAVYELDYELNNRPSWVGIPLAAILSLIS